MISPRTLLLFYRRHLRVQPLREAMAVMGVAAGVALLFTVQVANSSVTGSFEQIVRDVAGRATLELAARGPEGFDERRLGQVQAMAGVRAAAPVLEQRVVAVGPKGSRPLTLVGADELLPALGSRAIAAFASFADVSQRGPLVLTERSARAIGARPGAGVTLQIAGRSERVALGGAVPGREIGSLAESPIAAAPLPVVQLLAGLPGRVTRILIEPRRGQSAQLRRELDRRFGAYLDVRQIDAEVGLLSDAARPEAQLSALFSVIALAVGMILAYNALLLASGERRAFIRYLTKLGSPDSVIVASLLLDAVLMGLAGCVVGLALGDVISLYAYHAVPGYLAAAFAIGAQRVIEPSTVAVAVGAGMLAALAAAALPAIALLRGGAVEGAGERRWLSLVSRPRWPSVAACAFGCALVLGSLAASLLEPSVSVAALAAMVGGLVLCVPLAMRYVLGVARGLSRRSSDPAARLSIAELRVSPARSVALLTTGMIAVFLMVTIGGSVADVQRAVRTGAADTLSGADLWVRTGGAANVYDTQQFAYADTARRLRRLPAVRDVLPYRESFLDLPGRRVWVVGVPSRASIQIAPSQLVQGGAALASRRLREGGWAALSVIIARRWHLRVGERFSVPTPSGRASFRLAATVSNYGWLSGTLLVNGGDYSRLWRTDRASQLAITLAPGVGVPQGQATVRRALPSGSALTVQSDEERKAQVSSVLGSTLTRLEETSVVVLIATIATVVAMMISAVWQRRGRLDALLSIGMSIAQLARLVFYESGCVLLGGCLIGFASGILGQYLVDRWLQHSTGSPVQFAAAWQLGLRTLLFAGVISAATATIAVVRTVSFQPHAAFSSE